MPNIPVAFSLYGREPLEIGSVWRINKVYFDEFALGNIKRFPEKQYVVTPGQILNIILENQENY